MPALVFIFPDSSIAVFENVPAKVLITAFIFVLLAVLIILVRVLRAELTATRATMRVWQASLAFTMTTISHAVVPIEELSVERFDIHVKVFKSPTPTDLTLTIAFSFLAAFTAIHIFVRYLDREYGPL